jgi:hypothetical protein
MNDLAFGYGLNERDAGEPPALRNFKREDRHVGYSR